jgi:hypothetical protein
MITKCRYCGKDVESWADSFGCIRIRKYCNQKCGARYNAKLPHRRATINKREKIRRLKINVRNKIRHYERNYRYKNRSKLNEYRYLTRNQYGFDITSKTVAALVRLLKKHKNHPYIKNYGDILIKIKKGETHVAYVNGSSHAEAI